MQTHFFSNLGFNPPPTWFFVLTVMITVFRLWLRVHNAGRLADWARSKGYRVLKLKRPWVVTKGPFACASSRRNAFYRLEMLDEQGEMWAGWVRLPDLRFGLPGVAFEIRWDSGQVWDEELPGPRWLKDWVQSK
jgi:hypothetical protein